jgi:hypothetical protein
MPSFSIRLNKSIVVFEAFIGLYWIVIALIPLRLFPR